MNDRELVSSILNGNQQAFAMLVRSNQRLVGHMVARLVDNGMDREELCQDVFIKVYDKLHAFKFDSKLSTWIATIAYRAALNYLRKKKKMLTEQDLDSVQYSLGKSDTSVEDRDQSRFIQELVMQMPLPYRTVLTLHYLEGFSYPEIVKITEMPEGTVKNYLFRAKKKLRELAEPYIGKELKEL